MSLTKKLREHPHLPPLALLGLLAAGLLALAGCSSEDPNTVGLAQIETEFELVLEPLSLESITTYQPLPVKDEEVPFDQQELLYFGEQDGTASSVLLNFDFSHIYTEDHPESLWTLENIKSVKLLFILAEHYASNDSLNAIPKVYDFQRLTAPFDPADFPGGDYEPTGSSALVNLELVAGRDVVLPVRKLDFFNWLNMGGEQGFVLQEGDVGGLVSDPGLVGLASQENVHATQFPDETVLEDVRIRLLVEFEDELDVEGYFLYPTADISTFHQIQPVPTDPADGFCVRTCLRNYPVLAFDFSALPTNAYVNRAVLAVVNDTTTSYGTLEAIVVSEFPLDALPASGDSITLDQIQDEAYTIGGMVNLDPFNNDVMEFNVTTAVHRVINQVYEGERGFLLTGGEDIFPGYDITSLDPDFYLTRFNFFGTSAADSLRPRLKISYSLVEDLNREGE
ncbi:hypothetical protein CSB20_06585 [bacterium DOLZORAL124_64_63]|nr:MAG: hypothetical protein CSB20_06585 [bacterium DOLZORAL124_64_63]